MLTSQKLAIAAHVHVLLRRKTGRVTDTEWMAQNLEYALEIVRFTRAKALEDNHPELEEWADKLERVVLEPDPVKRPLASSAMQLLNAHRGQATAASAPPTPAVVNAPAREARGFAQSVFGDSVFRDSQPDGAGRANKPEAPPGPRYVGGIR
jgi:hypothetical protein